MAVRHRGRFDATRWFACAMCEVVCETDVFWAHGERAALRKLSHDECTRDHACACNCPTNAISLGNT